VTGADAGERFPPDDEETLFHEDEAPEPPGDWRIEDWLAFAVFWGLAGVVFLQFFTRYVLNDSIAWTEEIARYLLMAVGFIGSAMAARRGSHIAIEMFPMALPPRARRIWFLAVGLVSVVFFALLTWLALQITDVMQYQPMVVIDWPLSIVYGAVTFGLALTTLRFAIFVRRRFRGTADVTDARL
jgi:TRAP-type C4-dicarboxylate transport system permease small subunit